MNRVLFFGSFLPASAGNVRASVLCGVGSNAETKTILVCAVAYLIGTNTAVGAFRYRPLLCVARNSSVNLLIGQRNEGGNICRWERLHEQLLCVRGRLRSTIFRKLEERQSCEQALLIELDP